MRTVLWASIVALLLTAIVPYAWCDATHSGRPGSINYVEGQAAIDSQPLTAASVGAVELAKGQTLTTQAGKVEILLTPGVFLRVADNSAVMMVSPDLANIDVALVKGRAIIEAVDLHKENRIQAAQNAATITLQKKGLYDFDADHTQLRVFKGEAQLVAGGKEVKLKEMHMAILAGEGPAKTQGFDARRYQDEFYRWSALRSAYLSEASISAARSYVAPGPGWYGPGWVGWGWYWDPWFGAYTFVPADGIFWSPFGWGFYSPIFVYRSPYFWGPYVYHRFDEFHGAYGHGYGEPHIGVRR